MKTGDRLTEECQDISKGVLLRLWDARCSRVLQKIPPDPYIYNRKLPRHSKKREYIIYERGKSLNVCNDDFADAAKLPRMGLKIATLCPWGSCDSFKFRLTLDYGEATSPVNGVNASPAVFDVEWPRDTVFSQDFSSNSVGDPFGRGSSGVGTANFRLEVILDDPENTCGTAGVYLTATLLQTGVPWELLSGTPEVQERDTSCESFADGTSTLSGFWTAVYFGGSPIGLVMSLSYSIQGIPGSHSGCS